MVTGLGGLTSPVFWADWMNGTEAQSQAMLAPPGQSSRRQNRVK